MILEYTITDKMISSVISISEKIGQIKEIRSVHKHIDFDILCNVNNVQNILRDAGVSYPAHIITELMKSKSLAEATDEGDHYRIAKREVDKYRKIRDCKSYHPSKFIELPHKTKTLDLQPQVPREVIRNLSDSSKFFLYRVAEFCDACNTIINQPDLTQLWLITLFLEEYGMLLYFPYKNILEIESSVIIKNGKRLIDRLKYEANTKKSRYPFVEFYLLVIDSVLDTCIKTHHKLANPISGRVEILQGTIKEPFSRKDYMAYYKISTATASQDLRKAVEKKILIIEGDKRNAKYWYR